MSPGECSDEIVGEGVYVSSEGHRFPASKEEGVVSRDGETTNGPQRLDPMLAETEAVLAASERRCCTARSKSLTSLCRLQSHPAQYVSGIPSAAILLSISHPIRCSTRCLANVRARISGPMIAL